MFAIVQKDYINNTKQIVSNIADMNKLYGYISFMCDKNGLKTGLLFNNNIDDDIHKPNTYLVPCNNGYKMIEKYTVSKIKKSGATVVNKYNTLYKWSLIEYPKNTILEVGNTEILHISKNEILLDNNKLKYGIHFIIGKRACGKSFLTINLLQLLKNICPNIIENSICFSPTEQYSRIYKNNIPELKTLYEYDSEYLKGYLALNDEPGIIVLDDALNITEYSIFEYGILENLLINCRHYNKYLILTMQFPMKIKSKFRANIDTLLYFYDDIISNNKRVYYQYFSNCDELSIFDKFYRVINTMDRFDALVLTRKSSGDQIRFYSKSNTKI